MSEKNMNRTVTRRGLTASVAVGIVALWLTGGPQVLGPVAWAQDTAAQRPAARATAATGSPMATKILEDCAAAYQALDTYRSEGTVVWTETNGEKTTSETNFSILLKKPNLYLITWTAPHPGANPAAGPAASPAASPAANPAAASDKAPGQAARPAPASGGAAMPSLDQRGAVWSDGTQPYFYMNVGGAAAGGGSYSKMTSDLMALGAATGVSGGAAATVPSRFLLAFQDQPSLAALLKDPTREADEKVGAEDCYVVSGPTEISKKQTYWISKSKHLIVKSVTTFDPPEGGRTMPEMTDAHIEQALQAMGEKVTEASKKRVKDMMAKAAETMKNSDMRGFSTETHTSISSPELTAKDFQYVPQGATLRDSPALFGLGEPERTAPPVAPGENPAAVGPAGYVLDRAAFTAQLAAAPADAERLAILAKRWDQVMLAAAFCNVVEEMPFSSAMMEHQDGFLMTGGWSQRVAGDLREPIDDAKAGSVLIQGNCLANVKIADGALVYIYGDLGATVTVGGQCEVIVGGSIREGAGIAGTAAADIVNIFAGGDVAGSIRIPGSSVIWVNGSVTGEVATGDPSTRLHVMGGYAGTLHPVDKGALLFLDVRGFMPSATMEKVAALHYTELSASLGESDQPRGFYPSARERSPQASWVVHRQRAAAPAKN